jgi:hypothetical protein
LPAPSRGPGGAGLTPADCLGQLLVDFVLGVVALAAVPALHDRSRNGRVATPRRHVAIASVLAAVALFFLWPAACAP